MMNPEENTINETNLRNNSLKIRSYNNLMRSDDYDDGNLIMK